MWHSQKKVNAESGGPPEWRLIRVLIEKDVSLIVKACLLHVKAE